jgi:PQQ-like domain/WD40-like Beta Propeller Repeat
MTGPRSIGGRSALTLVILVLLTTLSRLTTDNVGPVRGRVGSSGPPGIAFVQARWESRGIGGSYSDHVDMLAPDGSDLRTLLPVSQDFNDYSRVSWSPDGTKVAFTRQVLHPGPGASIGPGEVVVMNADGTGLRVLATCEHVWCGYGVTWSPDGRRIAYQFKGIRVMDSDGGHDHAIWDCARGAACLRFNGPLSWSPDGRWILFGGEDRDDVGGVFLAPATGGTPKAITRCYSDLCYGGDRESNAVWSPDGSLIAFSREHNVFVIHPDGSGLRELSHCPTATRPFRCSADFPAWSPDGHSVAYTDQHAIYVVDAAGGTPRTVYEAPQGTPEPSPGAMADRTAIRIGYSICCLSWQPDGRTQPLALSAPTASPTPQSAPPIPAGVGVSSDPADWSQFGGSADHLGVNTAENEIGSDTVTSLREMWRSTIGDEALLGQSPVVVGDQLFVGGFDGRLYAFRASGCGAAECAPEWSGDAGGPVRSTPAVGLGTVFIGSSKGLFAFPASGCGRSTCAPLWVGGTGGAAIEFSSPVLSGTSVYVGGGTGDGRLYAFDARGCESKTCAPSWIGVGPNRNGIGSAAAVSGGFVFVRGMDPYVYAFKASGCGKQECPPLWKGLVAPGMSEAASAPVVADGFVYVGTGECEVGHCGEFVFAAAGCGAAVCDPVWTGSTYGGVGAASAVDGGFLFVVSGDGSLNAFGSSGCGHPRCEPLWMGVGPGRYATTPVIANGLVFVTYRDPGGGEGSGAVAAFPEKGCGGPACSPIWSTETGGASASVVAISRGMLFVSGEDWLVHAYGIS